MGRARRAGAAGRRRPLTLAVCATAAVLAVAPAGAQDVGYTGSVYFARGTSPTDEVSNVYIFNGVDVSSGPIRLSASVPFIRQEITFTGADVDPAFAESTSTGFGDPLVRLDLRLVNDRVRALQVSVAGSFKPSLVDADTGRGTGASDVAFGGSVFKGVGATSVFADLLYWKYGDPEGVDYEDSLSYAFGAGRMLANGRWSVMGSLSGFTQGTDGLEAPLQLNLAALTLVGRRQSLAVTAGIGLSDGASDFTLGTSWRIALGR